MNPVHSSVENVLNHFIGTGVGRQSWAALNEVFQLPDRVTAKVVNGLRIRG